MTADATEDAQWGWPDADRSHMLHGLPGGAAFCATPLVEAVCLVDEVSQPFDLRLSVVTAEGLSPRDMLGRAVSLASRLPNGAWCRRTGLVMEARAQEAGDGVVRHVLRVRPWIALLAGPPRQRLWRDITVPALVEALFAEQAQVSARAAWRWDFDVPAWLAGGFFGRRGGQRPWCRQEGECDLAFVQRLLAEDGVAWRVEDDANAPAGHRVVFFIRPQAQPLEAQPFAWAWRAGQQVVPGPVLRQVRPTRIVPPAEPQFLTQVHVLETQVLPAHLADRLHRALSVGLPDVVQDLADACEGGAYGQAAMQAPDMAALVPQALREGRAVRYQAQRVSPQSGMPRHRVLAAD